MFAAAYPTQDDYSSAVQNLQFSQHVSAPLDPDKATIQTEVAKGHAEFADKGNYPEIIQQLVLARGNHSNTEHTVKVKVDATDRQLVTELLVFLLDLQGTKTGNVLPLTGAETIWATWRDFVVPDARSHALKQM